MSRIKEYISKLEDLVIEAYEHGASTEDDIFAYVRQQVPASPSDVSVLAKNLFSFIEEYNNNGR